jgi:hypothetical protein
MIDQRPNLPKQNGPNYPIRTLDVECHTIDTFSKFQEDRHASTAEQIVEGDRHCGPSIALNGFGILSRRWRENLGSHQEHTWERVDITGGWAQR